MPPWGYLLLGFILGGSVGVVMMGLLNAQNESDGV